MELYECAFFDAITIRASRYVFCLCGESKANLNGQYLSIGLFVKVFGARIMCLFWIDSYSCSAACLLYLCSKIEGKPLEIAFGSMKAIKRYQCVYFQLTTVNESLSEQINLDTELIKGLDLSRVQSSRKGRISHSWVITWSVCAQKMGEKWCAAEKSANLFWQSPEN